MGKLLAVLERLLGIPLTWEGAAIAAADRMERVLRHQLDHLDRIARKERNRGQG